LSGIEHTPDSECTKGEPGVCAHLQTPQAASNSKRQGEHHGRPEQRAVRELTEQELDQVAGGTDNAKFTPETATNKAITGENASALDTQYIRG
jgi:hypothetical protein